MKILFVCSRNQWRSPTAEAIFKNDHRYHVKSAGTSEQARIKISEKMVLWADIIFVMERRHKQKLAEKFQQALHGKKVVVLDIPDEYKFMDPELIDTLKRSVSPFLC